MTEPQNGAIVRLRVADLTLHPTCELVPEMRPDEWSSFLADAHRRGIQDPITVQEGGVVLDGRHRLRAAKLMELETIAGRVFNLSAATQDEFVLSAALHRRHLSDDQRGMIAARYEAKLVEKSKATRTVAATEAARKTRAAKSQDATDESSVGAHGASTDKQLEIQDLHQEAAPQSNSRARGRAAESLGVSSNRVRNAGEVLRNATPELAAAVDKGHVSLAGARALADLPASKQRSIAAGGQKSIQAALRQPSLIEEMRAKQRERLEAASSVVAAASEKPKPGNGHGAKKPDLANGQNAPFIEARKLLLTMRTFLAAIQDFKESGALEDAQADWPEPDRREVAHVADAIHDELSDWPTGFVSLEESR